jgi:hypothetical protein
MPVDLTVEATDVPEQNAQSDGGTVATQNAQAPFQANKYKQGGKVNLSNCKVSTHEKSKSSPNW